MTNILTKMLKIMSEVDRIEKDRKNDHGGYKYASEKVIKEVLHFAFVKHGVVFSVSSSNPRIITSIGKDGKEISVCVALDVAYKFQDPDTGECIEGSCVGSGNPRDDKGIYAALTGAIKYILTSNFLIPTGDDPESNFFDRYKDDEVAVAVEPNSGEAMVTETEPINSARIVKRATEKNADEPSPAKDTLLTEKSRSAITANFDKLGIEIWDLEKKWGSADTWTMKTRSEMLLVYGKIIDEKINYSAKDFLEGKM